MQDMLFYISERWIAAFAVDLARYLVGVGVTLFPLFVVFRAFSLTRLIQQRRPTREDLVREITHSIKTVAVYATVALGTVSMIEEDRTKFYTEVQMYGFWYLIATVPLLLILHDTYFYWMHRLMHLPFFFRRIHRLHHLSKTPSSWAAYSFSVGEAVVMTLFVPFIILIMPVHPVALFVFLAIMIVRNAMGHSGVEFHPRFWVDSPLDLLTTVTHHDLHHQRFDGNYGLYFTWWDRLMGTEFPNYKETFRRVTHRDQASLNTEASS